MDPLQTTIGLCSLLKHLTFLTVRVAEGIKVTLVCKDFRFLPDRQKVHQLQTEK